jgi:hypothetical protein
VVIPSNQSTARLKYHKQRIEDLGNEWRDIDDQIKALEARRLTIQGTIAAHSEKMRAIHRENLASLDK